MKVTLQDLIFQLETLLDKINRHIQNSDYVYANIFETWVKRYNDIIILYNKEMDGKVYPYLIDSWEYSTTQKTVKDTANTGLTASMSSFINRLKKEVSDLSSKSNNEKNQIPMHQIRRCFKTGLDSCPINPTYEKNKAFIGMPFANQYTDSYEYGIKLAVENQGLSIFRADKEISNRDIMCKICKEIQTCGLAIFNISGLNPNVMLELGLALGIGKPVIIIKDTDTKSITDIGSIEYIEYLHAYDLQTKLSKALATLM